MPNYSQASGSSTLPPSPPFALYPGDSILLFNAEQPGAPQASIEVAIPPVDGRPTATISAEILFSGAPGAFGVQIQEADTDGDIFFITPGGAAFTISAVSANQVARSDLTTAARFLRGLLASRTNGVNLTLKLTRQA